MKLYDLQQPHRDVLDNIAVQCSRSKKGIAAVCHFNLQIANDLRVLGLVDSEELITERAWWLTESGVELLRN